MIFLFHFSPPADDWSIEVDPPSSIDPSSECFPPDNPMRSYTVSFEEQRFDRVGFFILGKTDAETLSRIQLLPPDPSKDLLGQPTQLISSTCDDLQKLSAAIKVVRPVLRQSCFLSTLSMVFMLYLVMVVASVLLLILSIWMS